MSISYYEMFTAYDWEGLCTKAGQVAPFVCFGVGGLALFLRSNLWIALWTIFAGVIVGQWETPALFAFVPHAETVQANLNEGLRIKDYMPRALAYFLLSYFCYHHPSPKEGITICALAGLYLDGCAILNIFANINRSQDAADGIDTQADSQEGSSLNKSGAFGTF